MSAHGIEVAPGVHRIEAPLGDRFVACYMVVGDEVAVLVDTGVADSVGDGIVPYIRSIGLEPARIRWIVDTHCDVDHMGGNGAARRAFPASVLLAHRDDAALVEDVERIVDERYGEFGPDHGIDVDEAMRAWCLTVAEATPVDLVVTGGESIRLGAGRSIDIIATPGHSMGSISVWDGATRSLLVGDAVLGACVRDSDGRPAFPPTYRHVREYCETIDRIAALGPEFLLAAHEPIMDAAAATDFLEQSRDFTRQLEQGALGLLLARMPGGATTREMLDELAPRMGAWPADAGIHLRYALVGHLELLTRDGRASAGRRPDGGIEWRATGGS